MFKLTDFVLEWFIAEFRQMLEEEAFGVEGLLLISADDISRHDLNRRLHEDVDFPELQDVVLLGSGGPFMNMALHSLAESLKSYDISSMPQDTKSGDRQQWEHDLRNANQAGKRGSKYKGR